MKLRIGHLSTFYHTAILLMADGRTPERLSTDAEWVLMGTGPDLVAALARSELDLAYIGLPPALVGIAGGAPIVCVAGGHEEGTVVVGREEDAGYPAETDLGALLAQYADRAIGVPGKGSIHDVILAEALDRHGLAGSVEVVNFAWADLIVDALADGSVSAAFGTPALAVAARRFAGCKLTWPPDRLWPENPSYGIIARRGFVAGHPELLDSFLLLHEDATRRMRETPEDAAAAIAAFTGVVDAGFVLETMSISPRYCAALTAGYIDCAMRFAAAMKALGYIGRIPDGDEVFDTSFIDRIHGPGEHYSQGIAAGAGG